MRTLTDTRKHYQTHPNTREHTRGHVDTRGHTGHTLTRQSQACVQTYVSSLPGEHELCYRLGRVATRELQFCIGGNT